MQQQWYYRRGEKTLGPVSRDELLRLVAVGQLAKDAPVIGDGMRDWVAIGAIDKPRPRGPSPPVKRPESRAVAAAIPPKPASTAGNTSAPRRPPNRQPRGAERWPLYMVSLVAVAAISAAVIWIAISFRSSDKNARNPNGITELRATRPSSTTQPKEDAASRSTSGGRVQSVRDASVASESVGDGRSPAAFDLPRRDDRGAEFESQPSLADLSATGQPDFAADPAIETGPPSPQPRARVQPVEKANNQRTEPVGSTAPQKPIVVFQELDIQRLPKFSVLGTVMSQDIHYRILSELSVREPDEKGFRIVSQVVKETQLVKADALSHSLFDESLKRLRGWQFSYTMNSGGEVIEMRGPDDGRKFSPVEPAGGKGFLITSVMDEDGWKELAELTFFQPDPAGMENQSWSRQMTHDYEPLGSWFGETTFVSHGKQQDLMRIDFAHKLTYKPPAKGAAAGGLPLTINNADFKALAAGGTIYFDTQSDRVQSAQEQFRVRGMLGTEVLGQAANVEVEEHQTITLRVLDQNPWNGQDD